MSWPSQGPFWRDRPAPSPSGSQAGQADFPWNMVQQDLEGPCLPTCTQGPWDVSCPQGRRPHLPASGCQPRRGSRRLPSSHETGRCGDSSTLLAPPCTAPHHVPTLSLLPCPRPKCKSLSGRYPRTSDSHPPGPQEARQLQAPEEGLSGPGEHRGAQPHLCWSHTLRCWPPTWLCLPFVRAAPVQRLRKGRS